MSGVPKDFPITVSFTDDTLAQAASGLSLEPTDISGRRVDFPRSSPPVVIPAAEGSRKRETPPPRSSGGGRLRGRGRLGSVESMEDEEMHSFTGELFVRNLPHDYGAEALRRLFSTFGELKRWEFTPGKVSRSPEGEITTPGTGVVVFVKMHCADLAFTALNYRTLADGSVINLKRRPRRESSLSSPATNVVVKSMPETWAEDNLIRAFGRFGKILQVRVLDLGIGFVRYERHEHALEAIDGMDQRMVEGHVLKVQFAVRKKLAVKYKSAPLDRDNEHNVYVKNLLSHFTQAKLEELFSQFGKICSARMLKDAGFVRFNTAEDAKRAIRETNGSMLAGGGQALEVKFAYFDIGDRRSKDRHWHRDERRGPPFPRPRSGGGMGYGRGYGRGSPIPFGGGGGGDRYGGDRYDGRPMMQHSPRTLPGGYTTTRTTTTTHYTPGMGRGYEDTSTGSPSVPMSAAGVPSPLVTGLAFDSPTIGMTLASPTYMPPHLGGMGGATPPMGGGTPPTSGGAVLGSWPRPHPSAMGMPMSMPVAGDMSAAGAAAAAHAANAQNRQDMLQKLRAEHLYKEQMMQLEQARLVRQLRQAQMELAVHESGAGGASPEEEHGAGMRPAAMPPQMTGTASVPSPYGVGGGYMFPRTTPMKFPTMLTTPYERRTVMRTSSGGAVDMGTAVMIPQQFAAGGGGSHSIPLQVHMPETPEFSGLEPGRSLEHSGSLEISLEMPAMDRSGSLGSFGFGSPRASGPRTLKAKSQGNLLYPVVQGMVVPRYVGKVTALLLTLGEDKVDSLISKRVKLEAHIRKAVNTLIKKGKAEPPVLLEELGETSGTLEGSEDRTLMSMRSPKGSIADLRKSREF